MLNNQQKALLLIQLLQEKDLDLTAQLSEQALATLQSMNDQDKNLPKDAHTIKELLQSLQKNLSLPLSGTQDSFLLETGQDFSLDKTSSSLFSDSPESSLFSSDTPTDKAPEPPVVEEPSPPLDPSLRTPKEIAHLLSKQKNQIIAFVLSKIDVELKESILDHFTDNQKNLVLAINIDTIPLSENVFNKLYDTVFKKSQSDDEPDTPLQNDDTPTKQEDTWHPHQSTPSLDFGFRSDTSTGDSNDSFFKL